MLVLRVTPSTKFHIANALHGSWPPQKGRESLDFRTDLKTGTASFGHFSFSEGLVSPDLRTCACQSLGHNPLILLKPILADFVSGSRSKAVGKADSERTWLPHALFRSRVGPSRTDRSEEHT